MKIFTVNGIPFTYKRGSIFCLEPVYLDIETSNNHAEDPADLRCWIVSIQVLFNGKYYLFRYPEELIKFYEDLYKKLKLYPTSKFNKKLVTYIHNASYDLSYLIPYINRLPKFKEIESQGIIEGPNKFLTYCRGSLEFKCSYLLSGMSLEKWSKEMNIEHKKQVGLYNYDEEKYPDDKLDADSEKYDLYDVLSMQECLTKQLSYHNDTLASVPLTATGYIRRTLRNSCRDDKYYRKDVFLESKMPPELYEYSLKSYAGGMTHNNRFYKDVEIVTGHRYRFFKNEYVRVSNIGHRDFKSHYPTQMRCRYFPLGRPQKIYDSVTMPYPMSIEEILSWYPTYSSISVIRIYDASLKDMRITMPFLQFSKCYEGHFDFKLLDNGRIIRASGCWIMYMDNRTLDIINKQYNLDYEVLEVYRMMNKKLPKCISDVVDRYFKGKSDKKNIVRELTDLYGKLDERTIEAEFELMQDKKGLNSIYGCTATNPLRMQLELTDDYEFRYTKTYSNMAEISEGLEAFYKGRNNFLPYIVGCMVTAEARHELFEYIEAIGYKYVLYCDTDSIFYIKNKTTEKAIERLNREKRKTAEYVTLDNGSREYYDEFTPEPDCIAFKGLHSKCYGVVTSKGLELTIAGVPARTLIDMKDGKPVYFTREDELSKGEKDPIKALDYLTDGFTFTVNTGVSAIYIGSTGYQTLKEPVILDIKGHEVHTAGGCVIRKLSQKVIHDIEYDRLADENIDNSFELDSIL